MFHNPSTVLMGTQDDEEVKRVDAQRKAYEEFKKGKIGSDSYAERGS